jgi:threonine synthase
LSGKEHDPKGFSRPIGLCTCCEEPGKPLVVEYDLDAVKTRLDAAGWDDAEGIWRYGPLLPVGGYPPRYAADVGVTPIVNHGPLAADLDVDLLLKDEGANPSGSFKDRGLSVGVALGAACGAKRFCLPTQGNAGVAAALFSARLGLPGCLVFMPDGYQDGLYHREAEFFGAEVRFAGANIAASGRIMREEFAAELNSGEFVDLSTFFEPGRLEGKKTMGLEIAESCEQDGLPDWIFYPTGGGTGLVGIWKAFQELIGIGRLKGHGRPLPRMVAVQSENCAPVVRSFERGLDHVEPVESKGTVADGLDVPGAIMGHSMLAVIRESGGTAIAVSETSILDAFRDCGRVGVPVSYESAATLAALRDLRARGVIEAGSTVLLLMTASHFIPLGQG